MCLVKVEFEGFEPVPKALSEVVDIAAKATTVEVTTLFGEHLLVEEARIVRVDLTKNVVILSRSVLP